MIKGRSGLALKSELWGKSIAFVILVTTLPWGLIAICWGMVASGVIDLVVMIHYVKKVMPIGYMLQLRHLTPVISLSAGTRLGHAKLQNYRIKRMGSIDFMYDGRPYMLLRRSHIVPVP